MLLHSALRKELSQSFGATLVVLATIVMTMMLIRTLRLASRGNINPSDVLLVLGYTVLAHLPTLLALSLFIAIVGVLSRMYKDSEMVIWFTSGQSLVGLLNPLLRFSWPILLSIGLLALLAWPWANQQTRELSERYEKRGDLERITPGQFRESSSGNRVFFIDKDTLDDKVGNNVFISATERGKQSITAARSGRIDSINDQRFLLLQNGQRLEIPLPAASGDSQSGASSTSQADLRISEFKEYGVQINANILARTDALLPKQQSSLSLLSEPSNANLGELAWRIGLMLSALNFVVIATAVSRVNPRAGRSLNLIFALLAFVVYFNLLNLSQNWIAQGKISFPVMLALLHGSVLGMTLLWLWQRNQGMAWRDLLSRKRLRQNTLAQPA
ncbi:MAG: LPS export ABC transporter permease LptF [Burkholderiales bacterium]